MRRHMLISDDEEIEGIRVRGVEVSRLEGLTDAVLGFAITLLVVSMEVPTSLDALFNLVLGFPAFALTFLLMIFIWYWHYRYFRQYGLNTGKVMWVNGILLFLVLLLVYPLKFLASFVVDIVILEGWFGFEMPNMLTFRLEQYPYLHSLYAVGFASVFLCFSWLYKLALNSAESLKLTGVEVFNTRVHMHQFFIVAVVPLATIIIVWLPITLAPMWAGFANCLIWPATTFYDRYARKQRKALILAEEGAVNG